MKNLQTRPQSSINISGNIDKMDTPTPPPPIPPSSFNSNTYTNGNIINISSPLLQSLLATLSLYILPSPLFPTMSLTFPYMILFSR